MRFLFFIVSGFLLFGSVNAQSQEINKDNFQFYLDQSRTYLNEYRPNQSRLILEKLYTIDSTNIQVCNLLGQLYSSLNNKTKADFFLSRTLKMDSLNLFALICMGDMHTRLKNFYEATSYYEYAIGYVDSTNYYILRQLGNLYFSAGESFYPLALDYFYKAIRHNPYDIYSYNRAGNIEIALGNYMKADSVTSVGLKYDEKNSNLINVKALALYNMKLYVEAINTLEINFQRKDSIPFSLKYAGLCHFNINNYQKARYFLEKSIKKDSTDYDPYIVLGQICLQQSDYIKGLDYLRRAERLHFPPANKTSQMYKIMADIYNQEKDWDKATLCFQKAYELIPEDITLICKLAYQYDFQSQKQKAVELYKKVVASGDPKFVNEIKLARDRLAILQKASK